MAKISEISLSRKFLFLCFRDFFREIGWMNIDSAQLYIGLAQTHFFSFLRKAKIWRKLAKFLYLENFRFRVVKFQQNTKINFLRKCETNFFRANPKCKLVGTVPTYQAQLSVYASKKKQGSKFCSVTPGRSAACINIYCVLLFIHIQL